MRCDNCNAAGLAAARFTYERVGPDGGPVLRMTVEGFECSNCHEQLILGRDAERISGAWYRVTKGETTVPVAAIVAPSLVSAFSTFVTPSFVGRTAETPYYAAPPLATKDLAPVQQR